MSSKEFSTEAEQIESKSTPILSKRLESASVLSVIGKVFILQGGYIDKSQDFKDKSKINTSAIHEVAVISKNAKLPLATRLQVKVKEGDLLKEEKDAASLLLGVKHVVVAFDEINHWIYNGKEGLNAKSVRVLNMTPEEAMKI
ncbi:hypothetical protein OZX69_00090 [Lactobacillus sp. ESL0731]|uniref:hypothetical protein n=1 Tax=unclassified Lactobacillus TaxID=2620435 RepID=UPI0023F63557|nr:MULTISPECIES: hypothetical protein [unclassified Lactobacillus]WEV51163.1 hypothetical protein OZX63_00090 [Lactobacillus sp. ESL0700]WEV62293.1 hypothetical protein OZX69_00090 [Lactobacillus sp. ESL0731]